MTDKSYNHKNDPKLYYSKTCPEGVKTGIYQLSLNDDSDDDDCYSQVNSEMCANTHVNNISVEQKSFFENKVIKILPYQIFLGASKSIVDQNTYLPCKEDSKKLTMFEDNFRMTYSMSEQYNHLNGIPSQGELLFDTQSILNGPPSLQGINVKDKYGNFGKQMGKFYFECMKFQKIDDSIKNWVEYVDDTNPLWEYMGEFKLSFDNNRMLLKSCNEELFKKKELIWSRLIEQISEILNKSNYIIHQFSKYANNCDYPKIKALLENRNLIKINPQFLQTKILNKNFNDNICDIVRQDVEIIRFLINYEVNTAKIRDCLEGVDNNILAPLLSYLSKLE